jgi:Protein of unknown function (DUF3268).
MNVITNAFKAAVVARTPLCPYCGEKSAMASGKEIYPRIPSLYPLNFWKCAPCGAYVGCHKPNKRMGLDGTGPLGRLANAALREAKSAAHESFDPIWQEGDMSRNAAYKWLADSLGINAEKCHIGEFDVDTCMRVVTLCASRCGGTGQRCR